jgi:hypothetical protein
LSDRLYAFLALFSVAWLVSGDVRWSFCSVALAACVWEVYTRTRDGLRNMAELKRLAKEVEEPAE